MTNINDEINEEVNNEPLLTMSQRGLHVASAVVAEKLEKKSISPSMITGISQCAAKWLAESFVTRDLIEEEPDNAAIRGTLFHKVMEDLFALPKEQRTKTTVKSLATEVIKEDEFKSITNSADAQQWLRDAINGYYSMGGNPQAVEVAEIEIDGKPTQKGLEIFVKGKIGNAKRDVLGFVDRLVVDLTKEDGSIIIEDWKSGTKAKKWKSHTKSDEGLAEQRQQLIYKILLEQKGIKISGARLIYPVAREIVKVDMKDEDLLALVVKNVEDTDKALDVMIENNTFEFKPSFLCSWCPISKICGAATIKPYEKMQVAYASQPPRELLETVIQAI